MLVSKKNKVFANHHSLLCPATKVIGDVYFAGDFYLEGSLKGNIYAEGGKSAKLIVTETGSIDGEVHVSTAIINGRVRGSVYASKHLELAAKAFIEGSVHYQSIEMVKGAQVVGQMVFSGIKPEPIELPLIEKEVEVETDNS